MERVLENYSWLINAAVIAFIAWLMAGLVVSFLSLWVGAPSAPKVAPPRTISSNIFQDLHSAKNHILERNLFDLDLKDEDPGTEPGRPGGNAVKTDLKITLIGTVVAPEEAKSVTTVKAQKKERYRIGDKIDQKHELVAIHRGRIEFINQKNRQLEYLAFPEPNRSASAPRASRLVYENQEAPKGPLGEGIRQEGDQIIIPKAEWDRVWQPDNLNQVIMGASGHVYLVNGKPEGFKIIGFRPGSIFGKLGIQPGDILKNVNGVKVNNALGVIDKLKKESNFKMQIERNGEVQTQTYAVQ
jgi:general secretion pathway protein C